KPASDFSGRAHIPTRATSLPVHPRQTTGASVSSYRRQWLTFYERSPPCFNEREPRLSPVPPSRQRSGALTGSLVTRLLLMPDAVTARTAYLRIPDGGAVSIHIAERSGIGLMSRSGWPA